MTTIVSKLHTIKNRMAEACKQSGRLTEEVKLLLATKTVSADRIKIALDAGETLIGENKVQELKNKFEALKKNPHQTHFIGHLQSNKIKQVLQYADCIQSVDRLSLADKLQRRLEFEEKTIDIFIQVNSSYEQSKFGIAPDEAVDFAQKIKAFDRLNVRGLMTIGLFSSEAEKVRACFKRMKTIQEELLNADVPVHELSMGMSNDLEIAIEEGATIIRVGTAVFGERMYPDSYYWNEKKGAEEG